MRNLNFPQEEEEEEEEEEEDKEFTVSENLDENGFPISVLSKPDAEEDESSFSSHFYRSGSDWSSLRNSNRTSTKKLLQPNLFQLWGLSKPQHAASPLSSSPPSNETTGHPSAPRKTPRNACKRTCPFYKRIPGTPFTVDAFRYGYIEGCAAYFLSHFHYDHYGGLSKGWSSGPIYCTALTGRLVKTCLSVNPIYINPVELDTEYVIEGTRVTFLEANHCPGAAMIHFRLADGRRYLHTGDFRACKRMQHHPVLLSNRVNVLYLDTTYCNSRYKFPSKEDVVDFVVRITKRSLAKQPKTLIIVGAYSIGKEQVYLGIAEALGVQIYTNASRRRILQSFDWPQISKRLCSVSHSTPLHVLPISFLHPEKLKQYLKTHASHFTAVLAFRPTGWTYSESTGNQLDLIRPNIKGNVTIYGVPYSEHSSYLELKEFVRFLNPGKIIPTVGVGNAGNRHKMQMCFQEWLRE